MKGKRFRLQQFDWEKIASCLPHFLVHVDGCRIRYPDKQVHKPSILLLTCPVQLSGQLFGQTHLAVLGRDSEGGDMAMPGKVLVAHDLHVIWIFLYLTHDWVLQSGRLSTMQQCLSERTIGDNMTPLILRYDEHGRPCGKIIEIELSSIVFG